jgi:hypothetical protein
MQTHILILPALLHEERIILKYKTNCEIDAPKPDEKNEEISSINLELDEA